MYKTCQKKNTYLCIMENVALSKWITYDWNTIESRPTEYGKYLVCRKDGKIHWETWNGSGWAYNNNVITHWALIFSPYDEI